MCQSILQEAAHEHLRDGAHARSVAALVPRTGTARRSVCSARALSSLSSLGCPIGRAWRPPWRVQRCRGSPAQALQFGQACVSGAGGGAAAWR